ncbi:WRKY transcription factor 1 [Phtheirospermum japonicum]|uniref:WRKY transcription factor 1 n=1 Tax=Phtheirospermum japonicum TaxID=374723 RepID=A0A830B6H7_9LAMI|nr:WRKY transcription factor 1 [Phtheirospermum japonicum]
MISYSAKFEKVEKLQPRRNPEPVVQDSLEKGLDDGYNWRKYGQKLVKGNKFIRSYYKCTFLNCQAKKQVEKSHDGSKTDVNYLGTHHHPKPQNSPLVNSTSQVRILDTQILPSSKSKCDNDLKKNMFFALLI